MKVVQVSAYRDYDGCQWTALFSSVEKAFEDLRNQPAAWFIGVDELFVSWVSVDGGDTQCVFQCEVKFQWGDPDTVSFRQWDGEAKEYVEVKL